MTAQPGCVGSASSAGKVFKETRQADHVSGRIASIAQPELSAVEEAADAAGRGKNGEHAKHANSILKIGRLACFAFSSDAQHLKLTGFRPRRIIYQTLPAAFLVVLLAMPILAPFPDIAVHLVSAERVGDPQATDTRSPLLTAFRRVSQFATSVLYRL